MARYFMGDTRLEGLERMMTDASRKSSAQTYPRKKPPRDRPVKPQPRERESKGRSV